MATAWTTSIAVGVTTLKPQEITELRTAINAERTRRALGSASFTDTTLTTGSTRLETEHISDARAAISSFAPLAVSEPTLVAGTTKLTKTQVDELRTKINVLEGHPVQGGVTDCNAGCTGLCVGCTGSCVGGCTSCTSCSSCSGCSGCSGCSSSCAGSCTGHSDCTCFPAGTRILMEDGSEKLIEDIKLGDRVLGIDGKAHNVIFLDRTFLGNRSLLNFEDNSLSWSEEHPLWVKHKDGEEYWGVWGYGAYLKEMYEDNADLPGEFKDFGLKKKLPRPIYSKQLDFAHVDGWKTHDVVINRDGCSCLPLFDIGTDGPGSMIANGYVVSAFATDKNFDFSKIRWGGLNGR